MTPLPSQPSFRLLITMAVLAACSSRVSAGSSQPPQEAQSLADLSLEELMRVEIVSASRRAQSISDVPAAVYVITRDDILRSGARSLPEALRMAPGVDVAQLAPSRWAVGVRGEAGRFSNKLQVLIDGRSIYSAIYSGVFWEAERVPMEDIERIEVIRGPAGAVWGNNAVNGVINIITRAPKQTQGSLVSSTVGTDGQQQLLLRHGMATGSDSWLRLYAQADQHNDFKDAHGKVMNDRGEAQSAGLRWDQSPSRGDKVSIQAQLLRAKNHGDLPLIDIAAPSFYRYIPSAQTIERANAMGSLEHELSASSELQVQGYLQSQRLVQSQYLTLTSNIADVDVRHRWHPSNSPNDVSWGVGLNWYHDTSTGIPELTANPSSRTLVNTRLFAQHEYALSPDKLLLTYGARIDHDPYSGSQLSPNARLLWKIDPRTSGWLSTSQAVRPPSRVESDFGYNLDIPNTAITYRGVVNPNARITEKVTAFEAGWRSQVRHNLSLDVAAFAHRYSPLLGVDPDLGKLINDPEIVNSTEVNGHTINTVALSRQTRATTRGFELAADWRISTAWRQQLTYARLDTSFAKPLLVTPFGASPKHLLSLRESFDLNSHWMLDLWLRYTSARQDALVPSLNVPARTMVDINVRWAVRPDMTISAGVHNLGPKSQQEINPGLSAEIPRAGFAKVEASF